MQNIFAVIVLLMLLSCNESTPNQAVIEGNNASKYNSDTTVSNKDSLKGKTSIDVDVYNSVVGRGVLKVEEWKTFVNANFYPTIHCKLRNTSKEKTVKGFVVSVTALPDFKFEKMFSQEIKPGALIEKSIPLNVEAEKYSDFSFTIKKTVLDDGGVY